MDIPELEQALLDHLVDELNDDGRRTANFLRSGSRPREWCIDGHSVIHFQVRR
jgi:hypothetical protein